MASPGITPYRKTHVRFDIAEPVVVEPPFGLSRQGAEIQPSALNTAARSHDVAQVAVGAWTLEPLQRLGHPITEQDAAGGVIRKAEWDTHPNIIEKARTRKQPELTGVSYDASVATQGNWFLGRRVAAAATWDASGDATMASDVAAYGRPTLPSQNVPLARWAVGKVADPADQGYVWSWECPGAPLDSPDFVKMLYFGGPATPTGLGQFALALSGGGMARLYERVSGTWVHRDTWEYAQTHRGAQYTHAIWIRPYRAPHGGGYLEFQTTTVQTMPHRSPSLQDRFSRPQPINATHIFPIARLTGRNTVTGTGVPRIDARNDLRFDIQVARLLYAGSGLLVDSPFSLMMFHTTISPLILRWTAQVPDGCSLIGRLYDAMSGAELTEVTRTTYAVSYVPTAGQPAYYAAFEFQGEGAGRTSPALWSYEVVKDGRVVLSTPGEFDCAYTEVPGRMPSGYPREISITGPEQDITHETASAVIEDKTGGLTRLRVRGSLAVRIETEYDPNNPSARSVLFDGDALKPEATRKGRRGSTFPSVDWRQFQVSMVGMAKRLRERPPLLRLSFAQDPNMPAGIPYKVTDVIRYALLWAGFGPSAIDVPDLPQRLWPAMGDAEALMMDPLADLWELIYKLAKDYLGWHIVWCGNSGTDGMWRLLPPAIAPYNNIAEFVTTGGYAGHVQSHPGAYPYQTTFVRNRTLRTYTVPPEANFVLVTGTGELTPGMQGGTQMPNWDANPNSFNFLTDAGGNLIETADPDHPDYLGRYVPLVIVNPALQTYQAVAFSTRRYYDIACRAVKMMSFQAPLLLVWDAADTYQRAPRPLRYYDAVLVDGVQWLVRNCNPAYRHDSQQWAQYELEAPRS